MPFSKLSISLGKVGNSLHFAFEDIGRRYNVTVDALDFFIVVIKHLLEKSKHSFPFVVDEWGRGERKVVKTRVLGLIP
jgi:hypothetical protein